jgi:hypothetical protein
MKVPDFVDRESEIKVPTPLFSQCMTLTTIFCRIKVPVKLQNVSRRYYFFWRR